MQHAARDRRYSTIGALGLIACGLASRMRGMPALVVLFAAGDVLWGSLFFVLGAWLRPAAPPRTLWAGTTAVVELIELSQLYQAPWAQAVRSTRIGGLLLGHVFLWSDVFCVVVGTSIAALVDVLWLPRRNLRIEAQR